MVSDLKRNGFRDGDISVLFPDKTGGKDFAHEMHTKAPEGAISGAIMGGMAGVIFGWLLGTGDVIVPALGVVAASGPLISALSAATVVAALGGFIGALIGLTIPEIVAKRYKGKIGVGNILISVHADTRSGARQAKQILCNAGCHTASITAEAHVPHKHAFAT